MNANTKSNLQAEAVAVAKRYNDVMGEIETVMLKYVAVDGSTLFADADELNYGVTGAEFKSAIGSLDGLRTAYVSSGHKTNIFVVTG